MTPTKAPRHKLYLIKRSPPEADRRGSVDRNASRVVAVRIEADARPFPKSGAGSGCLTHELGEDDDALALYAAFDVLGVIIDDHDVSHRGSPFRREVGAFDVQIFDQGDRVSRHEQGAVAILVYHSGGGLFHYAGLRPLENVVLDVEHVQERARPIFARELTEHAPRHDLYGRHLAPHTAAQAAPVVSIRGLRCFELTTARGARQHAVLGGARIVGGNRKSAQCVLATAKFAGRVCSGSKGLNRAHRGSAPCLRILGRNRGV